MKMIIDKHLALECLGIDNYLKVSFFYENTSNPLSIRGL